MKKYYGNYLGIVIGSGDDPENRNRIQVWIPHITNTLYDGWNNNPNIGNIDFFNFLQGNNTPNKELQDRIRNVLPWAECASPLFGGGSPVTQNLSNGQSSINSANTLGESSRTSIFDDLTDPLLPVEGDDGGLDIEPEPPEPENEEIEQGSSVASEDSGTVSDIAANNAKGSADGLSPVEPELPSDDYYPTPATGNFPSSNSTGETLTTLPSVGGGERVIQTQQEVATSRKGDLNSRLVQTIERGLAGTNLNWISTSGKGAGGVKNSQHKIGNATDGYFAYANKNNTPLDPNNPEDKKNIAAALYQLTQAGITGVGWDGSKNSGGSGNYYMGDNKFHLDVGSISSTWGHTTRGASAVKWIEEARNGKYNEELLIASDVDSSQIDKESIIENDSFAGSTLTAPIDGGYDGTSSGTYSVPDVGSKVWVFFHGGDIQKPIYFAQSLDPVSFDQTTQGT